MHADRNLAVQVAFADHVGAAGVDHSGRLQGLDEPPVNGLEAVPPRHLLNTGQAVHVLKRQNVNKSAT